MTTPIPDKAIVEKRIREAVPESMEHNFQWLVDNEATLCIHCLEYKEDEDAMKEPCGFGRYLNIQDVLLYLATLNDGWYVDFEGYFGQLQIDGWTLKSNSKYDLNKDFHNQSEEFYFFLNSIDG